MPNTTPNSPDRNDLRRKVRRLFAGRTHKHETIEVFVPKEMQKYRTVIAPYEPTVEAILELVDAHMDKLQQTIESGLPDKLNMDDAMLNYGWTDEEYIAWNKALRMCRSAITKAFEAAKAGKDSE